MKLAEVHLLLALVAAVGIYTAETTRRGKDVRRTRNFSHSQDRKAEAYVTLLYGDYLLSVRVLGQSLKRSGTQREMVVLCTEEVSKKSRKILEDDGWTVKSISALSSPYKNYAKQYSKVFTKLLIWTLTDYRRIVFMDSDTLVYANIDELFNCGKFCAAYRHSDLFNSGVLVVKPDLQEYRNLTSKIGVYPSYDNADQGFLNYYYQSLVFAPMFNASNPCSQELPMRLPAAYNADVGQYYVYTSRFFPLSSYKVLHHTLGPVKPWKWWAYPIFDLNWHWVEVRDDLQPSPDSPIGLVLAATLNLLFLATLIILRLYNVEKPTGLGVLKSENLVYKVMSMLILPVSCIVGFYAVPDSMHPRYAIPTFCLWTIFFVRLFLFCLTSFLAKTIPLLVHECAVSNFIPLICVVLFIPLALPLYITSFSVRVSAFLTLTLISFCCCQVILKTCLVQN